MATPRSGPGNILKLGNAASPYTPVNIALVGDIDGPTISLNTHDVTSQDTVNGFRQMIPALQDGGTVSFPLFFDANDTQHILLTTIRNNKELRYYELWFAQASPGKYLKFVAYITEFSYSFPIDGVITAQVTLTSTGNIDLV